MSASVACVPVLIAALEMLLCKVEIVLINWLHGTGDSCSSVAYSSQTIFSLNSLSVHLLSKV